MRLIPGMPVLSLEEGTVQIGSCPEVAIQLSQLSKDEIALLQALSVQSFDSTTKLVADFNISPQRVNDLLSFLDDQGILWENEASNLEASWNKRCFKNQDSFIARQQATITIVGLDRLGFYIARSLNAAGVGQLLFWDQKVVNQGDLNIYPAHQLGRRRQVVAKDLLPGTKVLAQEADTPRDLDIIISSRLIDAHFAELAQRSMRPYLPVIIYEGSVEVGPLILPDSPLCVNCLTLTRSEADPHWSTNAFSMLSYPDIKVEEILAIQVTGFVCREVTSHLGGLPSNLIDRSWTFSPLDVTPTIKRWPPHPSCAHHRCISSQKLKAVIKSYRLTEY